MNEQTMKQALRRACELRPAEVAIRLVEMLPLDMQRRRAEQMRKERALARLMKGRP